MWKNIKQQLDGYGMGEDVTQSFDEMLHDLNITYDDYIKTVHTSVACAKVFLKWQPNEIHVNQYTEKIYHFWRANHDIQPVLDPYAMVQYILSYITKTQKGMSSIMDKACYKAFTNHLSLKESVRHIGNAFLNAVETSKQEAAWLFTDTNNYYE